MFFSNPLRVSGKLAIGVDPLVAADGANGLALAAPGLCRIGGAIMPEISAELG